MCAFVCAAPPEVGSEPTYGKAQKSPILAPFGHKEAYNSTILCVQIIIYYMEWYHITINSTI